MIISIQFEGVASDITIDDNPGAVIKILTSVEKTIAI